MCKYIELWINIKTKLAVKVLTPRENQYFTFCVFIFGSLRLRSLCGSLTVMTVFTLFTLLISVRILSILVNKDRITVSNIVLLLSFIAHFGCGGYTTFSEIQTQQKMLSVRMQAYFDHCCSKEGKGVITRFLSCVLFSSLSLKEA